MILCPIDLTSTAHTGSCAEALLGRIGGALLALLAQPFQRNPSVERFGSFCPFRAAPSVMREIVSIQGGQCGNQIGATLLDPRRVPH